MKNMRLNQQILLLYIDRVKTMRINKRNFIANIHASLRNTTLKEQISFLLYTHYFKNMALSKQVSLLLYIDHVKNRTLRFYTEKPFTYDAAFKRKVILCAEKIGNRAASRN
jgi:hypothetical protein